MQKPMDAFEDGAPLNKAKARALSRQSRRKGSGPPREFVKSAPLVAKTANQKTYLKYLYDGDSIISVGSAGCGKTYLAARVAAKALMENRVERIIICRATVSKPKHQLGFLPGNLEAKLKPWLIPILDGFKAEVSAATIDDWKVQGKIEFLSFEHMRGRTLQGAFVLLDEAQNCDLGDLRMFLTRAGEDSQIVVTGDMDQVDIPVSGLPTIVNMVRADPDIGMEIIEFTEEDVVRSKLAKAWVKAFSRSDAKIKSFEPEGILDQTPAFLNNGRRMSS